MGKPWIVIGTHPGTSPAAMMRVASRPGSWCVPAGCDAVRRRRCCGDAQDARRFAHRRKCMEFLLPHLALMPCSTITLESRGQLDASDLDMLQKLRSRKVVESTVRIEHSIGRNEPALWAADVVCGAVDWPRSHPIEVGVEVSRRITRRTTRPVARALSKGSSRTGICPPCHPLLVP